MKYIIFLIVMIVLATISMFYQFKNEMRSESSEPKETPQVRIVYDIGDMEQD